MTSREKAGNPSPGPSPGRGGEQDGALSPPSLVGKGAGGLGPTHPRADVFVSAVAVLRSYARFLPAFADEVIRTLDAHYTNFELVLVDNGSRDDTPAVVRELLKRHRCVRYLRLSRRMKAETAAVAGLDAAIGDFVVTLHPEFDPPAELPAMVERCRGGADVVIGSAPFPTPPGVLYRLLRWGFVRSARWLLKMDPVRGSTGYRVLSRAAVNALTRVRQRRRFFDLLASDIGFTTATHRYRFVSRSGKVPRKAGVIVEAQRVDEDGE